MYKIIDEIKSFIFRSCREKVPEEPHECVEP